MKWCNDNQNICIFVLVLIILQCTGYLTKILNYFGLEGFQTANEIFASEEKVKKFNKLLQV